MDPIASARAVLPAWAAAAGLLYWPAAVFLIGWTAAWLVSSVGLRPLRRLPDAHWTERARIGYPVRVVLAVCLAIALVLPTSLGRSVESPFAVVPGWLTILGTALAGWAGVSLGARRSWLSWPGWLGMPRLSLRDRLRGGIVFAALYLPTLGVFAVLVAMMPPRMNGRAWITLAVGAVAMALVVWRSGIPFLRLLGLARPASERLRRAVDRAVERVGVRPAAVWEVSWPAAGAMALVFCRQLAFTDGALCVLKNDDELATVAAHELGHLSEPVKVKIARTFGVWILLALSTAAPLFRSFGWAGLGGLYVAVVALSIALRRLGRRMEVRADAIGRGNEGTAGTYARALERMYEVNLVPAVLRGRLRVHPSLWDRMTAAGITPDYPRPEPPSRRRTLVLYLLVLIVFTGGWIAASAVVPGWLAPRLLGPERALAFRLGLDGDLAALRGLASLRGQQGRKDESVALWRADSELDPHDIYVPAYLASLEAGRGHCAEAARYLGTAQVRLASWGREDDAEGADDLQEAQDAVATCGTGAGRAP
jgi:Zn-dependent protease with chaperone function